MRRFRSHPYGDSVRPMRLVSMFFAIALLWMLFGQFKDPATWRGLLDIKDEPSTNAGSVAPLNTSVDRSVVLGPNDLDSDEQNQAQEMFQLVRDRTPLKPREMHAYWRLLAWSHTAPFAELQKRALQSVPMTQLWEQPEKYRGKPISLRLHVRRVLKYDAPKNPEDRPFTYEAWGWTDESRSFPFVVVFSECPAELTIGTDVRCEVEFVGYFLKVMSYTAFDKNLSAPLLVGRVTVPIGHRPPVKESAEPTVLVWVILAAAVLAGFGVWSKMGARSINRQRLLPAELSPVEAPSFAWTGGGDETSSGIPHDSELVTQFSATSEKQ